MSLPRDLPPFEPTPTPETEHRATWVLSLVTLVLLATIEGSLWAAVG